MRELSYLFAKVIYKLAGNKKEVMSEYFRKAGMIIGKDCNICCNIMSSEPYLITIGDNVTISGNVSFLTHDNSISKVIIGSTDIFGNIIIGNNCFIGANSTILYGVTLADNIIVAAGSVVTKSFKEERIIIGGNPAKKIGIWESMIERHHCFAINTNGLTEKEKEKSVKNSLLSR